MTTTLKSKVLSSSKISGDGEDPFWGEDLSILFTPSRLIEFFPVKDQNASERLNAISRLVLYVSICLMIVRHEQMYLFFGIFILTTIYIIWQWQDVVENGKELFDLNDPYEAKLQKEYEMATVGKCTLPSKDNPMGNILPMQDTEKRKCEIPQAAEMAAALLDESIEDNVDYAIGDHTNKRAFLPVPERNDDEFRNVLFKDYLSCKTNPKQCQPYIDMKNNRELIDASQIDPAVVPF